MVWVLPGRKLRPWSEFPFPYRFYSSGTKIQPKEEVLAGYPCGHPAKNFGQALQILEKQAFWNGHPPRTSMKKLPSEKLGADFPFPNSTFEFWRFKFSVVWILVWVSSFYGDGGGSRTVSLNELFPLLTGPFPTLMGRFTSCKSPKKQPIKTRPVQMSSNQV